MTDHAHRPPRRIRARLVAAATGALLVLAGCRGAPDTTGAAETPDPSATAQGSQAPAATSRTADLFDSSTVHDISVAFDEDDYAAMMAAFSSSGEKEWIEATVTIDGTAYEHVGMRLKGNSSLFGLTGGGAGGLPPGGPGGGPSSGATTEEPESLPWLVRLDKYVDGQDHDGITELVVRSNTSETALNEAVALELLGEAGLATQEATPVRFSVNDGDAVLRLVIENPGDEWDDASFDTDGILYKAESGGDYSYRGDDAAAYVDVFDQETDTDEENLAPLIEFLDFLNNADDETFAAEIVERLDVEAFADYLAVQDLIGNMDDIDGPGNNSYLRYDEETGQFTVVAWDHNLAFAGGGAGRPQAPGAGQQPPAGAGQQPPQGLPGGGGGMFGRSNVLVERFMAVEDLAALVEASRAELTSSLYDSGVATEILERWVGVLKADAGDLVDADTVDAEAARVAAFFDGA